MTGRPDRDVLLCRDCCCGSERKHPGADHRQQREQLEACAGDGVRVRVVECLDACERSNVVVVRDLTGARPVDTWLGDVLDAPTTTALAAWVRAGGPLPDALAPHVVPRTRP